MAVIGLALAASLFVGVSGASGAPPDNDMFASARIITGESGSAVGSTSEATKQSGEPAHAGNAGGRSVWYLWTAPATEQTIFETCGTGLDTLLAVYEGGSVTALALIGASDDGCSEQSILTFPATAGVVYSIAVDGYGGATGSFTLRWRPLLAPRNDNFAAAEPLSGTSGSFEETTLGGGTEPGERPHAGSSAGSVWFSWTVPVAGVASIDTCGSSFDTRLAVYTGDSVAALTQIASNDDSCGLRSRVRFAARAGTTYRIAVVGVRNRNNAVDDLALSWVIAPRPTNDTASMPRTLRGMPGSLRTSNAGALTTDNAMVWFRWKVSRTMGVSFDTCSNSTLDTVLTVYRGRTLRGAVRVDEDDDSCAEQASRVAFLARRGVDYLIAVGGVRGAWGSFTLRWAAAGPSAGTCRVPEVRGMTLGQAGVALEQVDCVLGRVAYSPSAIFPRGRVISQYPIPNTRLRFLGRVNVEISSG